jgi:hypothetical protein
LGSGSEYPCSVGINTNVFCFYEKGSTSGYGKPTRIHITKFALQSGNTLSLRLLFTNPDIVSVYPSFHFKAYGGSYGNDEHMGDQFMGEYTIHDAFKTFPELGNYTVSSCQANPTRTLNSDNTQYYFYIDNDIYATTYVMLEWRLSDSTYGEFSEYNYWANVHDVIKITYSKTDIRLYLIKKWTSTWIMGTNDYHTFGYFKNNHFLTNDPKIYYFETS